MRLADLGALLVGELLMLLIVTVLGVELESTGSQFKYKSSACHRGRVGDAGICSAHQVCELPNLMSVAHVSLSLSLSLSPTEL